MFIQCICLIDRDLAIKRWGWDLINSFNPVLFFYLNKPQRRCPLASVVVYFVFWGDRFTRGVVYVCYIVDHLFIFNFLIDCWLLNVHWQIFPSYSEREQVQQYMYITIIQKRSRNTITGSTDFDSPLEKMWRVEFGRKRK